MQKPSMQDLENHLCFLYVSELKRICEALGLPAAGKKPDLITAIVAFKKTGEIMQPAPLPAASRAKPGKIYPLKASTPILEGAYKNDAKTREFMKTLVGGHFHFTAAGIDWLQEQWKSGNPPTYAEFARWWQERYVANKKKKPTPKKEWALIHFVLRFRKIFPHATREEVVIAWHAERARNVRIVRALLELG